MSILDNVENLAKGEMGGRGNSALNMIAGLIRKSGGIGGLIATLRQGGLGGLVESWVGTGPNQPVSGQQLQQALAGTPAGEQVDAAAQQAGVDSAQAHAELAKHLPDVVDHLTPDGQVPAGSGSGFNVSELSGLAGKLGL